ncbi:hypothetical protein RGQ15_13500 [Paracoccus sp. MBLB3053]|uniref:Uncharacterized protein n=1 Tax=Paracoccus aurantius TaxID=3073814 RepID=A0ABU2HVE9_9RHOB|nr:hypothetical protein [Paracoccus sp. MBLB3053]MDS9468579.1 hypothetical protein [Paracoccus sp. MBLB3053]
MTTDTEEKLADVEQSMTEDTGGDGKRVAVRALARALWASENQHAAAGDEKVAQEWKDARVRMVRVANSTIRRLKAKGFILVKAE